MEYEEQQQYRILVKWQHKLGSVNECHANNILRVLHFRSNLIIPDFHTLNKTYENRVKPNFPQSLPFIKNNHIYAGVTKLPPFVSKWSRYIILLTLLMCEYSIWYMPCFLFTLMLEPAYIKIYLAKPAGLE